MRIFTARDTGVTTMAWSATQGPRGILYFGCDTVVSFDGDRWRPLSMAPTYLVRGLDVGADGRVWAAGVNEIGWFGGSPSATPEYHSLVPMLPAGSGDLGDVWRAYAQGKGAVFVARDRVLRWDGSRFASWSFPGMHLLWSTRTARAVYIDYPPTGLLRLESAGPVVAAPASVIGSSEVRWLDDSGDDLLLLTSQGFKSLRGGTCVPVDTQASAFARANIPSCAARLRDGRLAVGSLQGGVAILNSSGQIERIFGTDAGLPTNQVYALYVDRDGALWCMGPSSIVRLGIESGVSVLDSRSGYPPGGCLSLALSSGQVYAVGHSDLLRLGASPRTGAGARFVPVGSESSRFYSLLRTPQGLAVGDVKGLSLWSADGSRDAGALRDAAFRITPSSALPGRVLVSLSDRVAAVDLSTGASAVVADSLPDYADTVADDAFGRTWMGTPSRGLFVAGRGSRRAVPASSVFAELRGAGPALVGRAGGRPVFITRRNAWALQADGRAVRRVDGIPDAGPLAVSNPDSAGAVWVAFEPELGAHSVRLGRIEPGSGRWTPQSVEGINETGSLLGLRVLPTADGDDLWILGTEALLCARPGALAAQGAPVAPLLRAWPIEAGGPAPSPPDWVLPSSTRGIHIEYSSPDYGMRESERFQTMLGGAETLWSAPTQAAERDIAGLRDGSYTFRVRMLSDSGAAGSPSELSFTISPPWWATGYARTAIAAALVAFAFLAIRLRTRALNRRAHLLEAMVQKRTEELQKASAAKTEFVSSMSHEIRNPMGGILSSALELSETPLGPHQDRLVTTIRTCATFLASLVEDVLDFAAIEEGAYKVSRAAFRPAEILETVATMLAPRAQDARIDVRVGAGVPEWLAGDAARIQQVIVNFAGNSLKFGGHRVVLSVSRSGGEVVFAVDDDGIGVPADEQRNLFIRFSRLKSARNSAIPGTGLGLAVSRTLAERMGGKVSYQPGAGRGSRFCLKLPLEATSPDSAPAAAAHGSRALVVEDLDYNARALGLMLSRMGFETYFAADGPAALELLSQGAYNAVFIDCDLPGLSGIEVARRLRGMESGGRRALVVATTALTTAADRQRCLEAGMDVFLAKPITPEKLKAALGLAINAPEAAGRTRGPFSLDLIRHLAGDESGAVAREVAKFMAALDDALRGLGTARASGSRAAVASAAHRILSLARMIGDDAMASAAADLQEYAAVYSEIELGEELAGLSRQAGELTLALARLSSSTHLSPSRAS
ncbi:MAG TPA: ATP-binding protein [Opitutaceae bacterium]|jgi:signal transduction histidine kinase/ActR/RegA family two-component response regulator